MIEVFKIVNDGFDIEVCGEMFERSEEMGTRGHGKKLYKRRSRLDKR